MLNTKPIKKSSNNSYVISTDEKNAQSSDKIIKFKNPQEELKEIVNEANTDNLKQDYGTRIDELTEQENNSTNKMTNQLELNKLENDDKYKNKAVRDFQNPIYRGNNLNMNNVITGGKLINNFSDDGQVIFKNVGGNVDSNLANSVAEFVEWSNDTNCYIIYENYKQIHTITNESILKSILDQSYMDFPVKKYIFITSWNQNSENYEFNFVESIFTNNFDIIIKMQNFIYETLMNFENLGISDTYNYSDAIMMFYFQLVIFEFGNLNKYLSLNDPNKISRMFSSLVYRFSSLVLKNVLKLKSTIDDNDETLKKLLEIRVDIFDHINLINEKINIFENNAIHENKHKSVESNKIENNSDKNSQASSTHSKQTNTNTDTYTDTDVNTYTNTNINSIGGTNTNSDTNSYTNSDTNSNTNSDTNSDTNSSSISKSNESTKNNNKHYSSAKLNTNTSKNSSKMSAENGLKKMNVIGKKGKMASKVNDFFSDDIRINTENSDSEFDSEQNGYYEIDDTISEYSKIAFKNNLKKINPIENSFQSNSKSIGSGSREPSYNPNSAMLNGKIYKVNI